jgi:serine/threonine-protein kinase
MLVAEGDETYTVKIVDFGLAKSTKADENAPNLTQTGALIGTPSYMSPEQCRSEATDHRCDLYAIGCMMHEMLTGEVPFVSANIIETFIRHAQEPPPALIVADLNPQVNAYLQSIVHRCLEKNKENRYQSAAQLLQDLSRVAAAVR